MSIAKEKSIAQSLKQSWWVFLFLAVSSLFYFHGMHEKNIAYHDLTRRLSELEMEKALALSEHDDLKLQIKSQSDPEWIQLTLMKGLGMVPDGQVKVYFKTAE
jgi:hypothetical protein